MTPLDSGAAIASSSLHGEHPIFPGELPFVELAGRLAGFGGLFVDDDGNLVAYLTNLEQADLLRPLLEPTMQAARANHALPIGAEIVIREGQFEFLELRDWRDHLTHPVLSTPGVVFLDLDERQNRIAVGTLTEAVESSLNRTISAAGIPLEAVVFQRTGPVVRTLGPTLRDNVPPLVGGLQLRWRSGAFWSDPCTVSFNANWAGQLVWLTNSHCTEVERSVTASTEYWQADAGGLFVGNEAHDPLGTLCAPNVRCRGSDAAILTRAPGVTREIGGIARPQGPPGFGWGQGGSITLDPAAERFRIVSDNHEVQLFWFAEKVGRTTGWTSGQVLYTCVHFTKQAPHWSPWHPGSFRLLCQHGADFFADHGDSGSPVFSRTSLDSNDVRLFGILWGRSPELEVAWFSPMSGVRYDLGHIHTLAPQPSPPPGGGCDFQDPNDPLCPMR